MDFSVTVSTSNKQPKSKKIMFYIILALVLLAIVGGMIAEHKKHKKGN